MRGSFVFTGLLLIPQCVIAGEVWPQFRGPDADGHSNAVELPLSWDAETNIVWKTPIHDRGWCSPVIWYNQIWMTTATADGHKLPNYGQCEQVEQGM